MKLELTHPGSIYASGDGGGSTVVDLKFYKNRQAANGHVIRTLDAQGAVLDQVQLRIAPGGQIRLERMVDEIIPAADKAKGP